MRFGWLTLAHSPSADADYAAIDDLLVEACRAEDVGFDGVWLTEHNFTGEAVYCDPIPFASALAARTSRVRIGFAVIQLALRHPIRLAVQLALLDNLSRGRLDVGVGRGSLYNEYEFVGYGLRSDDSRERSGEALEILTRAWTEEPFAYQGKFYQVSLPALRPRVYQRPHPPIWRSVVTPALVRRVRPARRAHHDVAARPRRAPGAPRALRGRAARGRARGARRASGCSATWRCGATSTWRRARPRPRTSWPAPSRRRAATCCTRAPPTTPRTTASTPPCSIRSTTRACRRTRRSATRWTPARSAAPAARVAEQMAELRDAGVHHVLCQMSFGYLGHDRVLASMQRFGEHVVPALGTAARG